jgi:transitional endoplasmic reticulum ATPase
MSLSWDEFERLEQKAIDLFRAGQFDAAQDAFRRAAGAVFELSKTVTDPELKQLRLERADKLLGLSKRCDAEKDKRRQSAARVRQGGGGRESSGEAESESTGEQWLVKEKPSVRFADVAGLEEVKEDIRLKMIYPFQHADLAAKFGIRPGGGVLLYGPPGTGKTMLAKATAGEIDASFFRISPADILSKWVGEAEQNIKKLFDAAANEKQSIIFIDEMEALVPARKDEGGSSVMQRVVPQILQGMEGFDKKGGQPILFMGATNVPWQLDPAVMRPGRFDEKVYIPLPDLAGRRQMLQMYLGKRPLAPDVALDEVAQLTNGYSGADMKYLCDRAATIPFLESVATGKEGVITLEVIKRVIRDTPPSVSLEALKRFDEWRTRAAG